MGTMYNEKTEKLFNKNSILLLSGTFLSKFGDILYSVAIGYYVLHLTGSTALMGVFASISMFVTMFIGPFSGTVVDRIKRKWILCGTDLLRGGLMLVVGWMSVSNLLSTPALFILSVLVALSSVFFQPASTTTLLDVVPEGEYIRASSINATFFGMVDLVSKSLSGFLLAYFGIGQLIIYNGAIFIIAAVAMYFIAIPQTPKQGSGISVKGILNDFVDGFKALVKTKGLNTFFGFAILINLFSAGYLSLFLLITEEKGFSLNEYGFLMLMISLGGFLGALPTSLMKLKGKTRFALLSIGLIGGAILMMIGLASHNSMIVGICFLVGNFLNMIGNTIMSATLMILMPNDKRATILGFLNASSMGGYAISTLLYGFIAGFVSISLISIIGTLISTILTVIMVMDKAIVNSFADKEV